MNFAKFFGPLSNLQFDKLLIADVLTTFCDVIMQFLLIAWILDFAKNPATPIVGVFISFVAAFLIVSPFCGFFADKYQKNRLLSASCFYRTFLEICSIPWCMLYWSCGLWVASRMDFEIPRRVILNFVFLNSGV